MKEKIYKIGITGHRDLEPTEIEAYKQKIEKILLKKQEENKDKRIVLCSPLATGADTIFIEVGQKLNFEYEVILPMKKELYAKDFNEEEFKYFESLLNMAIDVRTINLFDGNTNENIKEYGYNRDYQYRAVGRYLANNCDFMLALFNEDTEEVKFGGTADIVIYMNKNKLNYSIILCKRKKKN